MKKIKIKDKSYALSFCMATWLMYEQNEGTSISQDLEAIQSELQTGHFTRIMRIAYYELFTSNPEEEIAFDDLLSSIASNEQAADLIAMAVEVLLAYMRPKNAYLANQDGQKEGQKKGTKKSSRPTKSTRE